MLHYFLYTLYLHIYLSILIYLSIYPRERIRELNLSALAFADTLLALQGNGETDGSIDRLIDWLIDWLDDQWIGWPTDWLVNLLIIDSLTDWMIDKLFDWFFNQLIDWPHWFIDKLIDRSINCWTDDVILYLCFKAVPLWWGRVVWAAPPSTPRPGSCPPWTCSSFPTCSTIRPPALPHPGSSKCTFSCCLSKFLDSYIVEISNHSAESQKKFKIWQLTF